MHDVGLSRFQVIKLFREAMALVPDSATIMLTAASYYQNKERLVEAHELLKKVSVPPLGTHASCRAQSKIVACMSYGRRWPWIRTTRRDTTSWASACSACSGSPKPKSSYTRHSRESVRLHLRTPHPLTSGLLNHARPSHSSSSVS